MGGSSEAWEAAARQLEWFDVCFECGLLLHLSWAFPCLAIMLAQPCIAAHTPLWLCKALAPGGAATPLKRVYGGGGSHSPSFSLLDMLAI